MAKKKKKKATLTGALGSLLEEKFNNNSAVTTDSNGNVTVNSNVSSKKEREGILVTGVKKAISGKSSIASKILGAATNGLGEVIYNTVEAGINENKERKKIKQTISTTEQKSNDTYNELMNYKKDNNINLLNQNSKLYINVGGQGGSTNGEAGIKRAYQIAEANFVEGGNNRVIIASDGDMNVGISSPDDLEKLIEEKKESGVFLSVLGFGTGNYKDDRMERLADCGNGNYSYIDSMLEAKKVLVEEMNSTLYTVAKDAKFQVEFNPNKVNAYRLIGYENRIMDATDFNDDTKDGGEIGSGHTVIALYEIIEDGAESAVELKYQNNDESEKKDDSQYADEFATVNIRYKEPDADTSELISVVVNDEAVSEEPSENLKFAGMVAEFAMILSDSEHKGNSSFEYIMDTYKTLENKDEYKEEFNQLVRMVSKNS